jgi:serine/threonine protein phosphatase PrpC
VAANAGDSRVVLFHEGVVTRLTEDHRASDLSEVARIEQAGGFLFRERVLGILSLTRSIGDHLLKRFVIGHPSVMSATLDLSSNKENESTLLILACDGVFDVLSDEQAVAVVRENASEGAGAARCLVEEALTKGSTDNVSAIVIWLDNNDEER